MIPLQKILWVWHWMPWQMWAVVIACIFIVLDDQRTFIRTCMQAAKLLPTVKSAIPKWIWPILAVASIVKMLPVDFFIDETLFFIAFVLISWRRPGLLKALYREAQAGRPVPCVCEKHRGGRGFRISVLAR